VIVAAFILGIALGSAIFGRLADWTGKPHALLAGCLAVAGVAGPLSPLVLERVPLWLVGLVFSEAGEGSFARLQAIQFSLLFAILLVPTTALGGAFPLVARALAPAGGDGRGVASVVGRAYAVNTLAAILGSMATGFLLVPAQSIGIQGSLRIAGGLAIVAAAAVAFGAPLAARLAGPRARLARRALFATGALAPGALVLLWSPAWDVEVMGAGIYLYGPVYARKAQESKKSIREVIHERGDVVFHREGVSATVQVKEFEDERTGRPALVLLVNGKPEATTSGDMRTQTLLGHLATVFHPAPESGLVIGLGGGLTLASMATHDLSAIDCVEISDAVVEAAQRDFSGLSFARANGRVLEQAGVRLILGDGRTHVFFGEDRYDVLSSEPSNPWIAGVANLFTIEFFRQARERLAAGGLICQWVQAYRMSVDDFRMIVRTFRSVFPEACLFKAQSFENAVSGDFFLVAGRDGFDPPMSAVVRALKLTRVARDLAAVEIETPLDLVDGHVLGPAELDAFAGEGPVNTDDNALLEFSSPRSFYSPGTVPLLGALLTYRRGPPPWWTSDGTIPEPAAVARYRAMTAYYASIVAWGDSDYDTAVLRAEEALAADPTKKGGKDYVVRLLGERADARIAANRVDDAIADYLCMLQHDPGRAEAWLNLGDLYLRKGMASRAEAAFKNATLLPSAEPRYVALAHANLARLYLGRRDLPGARREFASALALDPENADILYDLARLEFDEDRLPAALEYAARAARTGSRRTDVHNLHGDLLRLSGRPREALSAYRASLAIDGDQGEVELRLSELHYQLGEFDEAYDSLERATSLGADVNPAFRANVRRAAGK
ncbi:MAG: tetratricopeptide repeat protein, partial [Planctomycetes bacterium]|nr:tetratricopeptide repeat protein [Planctomycetota bacterium]